SQLNVSWTIITVTLAPADFANDNPFVTACSANSDPSVGMRICRNMLHLSIARAIASISELCVQFLEQNHLSCHDCGGGGCFRARASLGIYRFFSVFSLRPVFLVRRGGAWKGEKLRERSEVVFLC